MLKGPSAIVANILFFIACVIVVFSMLGAIDYNWGYFTPTSLAYLVPNIASMNCYVAKVRIFSVFYPT